MATGVGTGDGKMENSVSASISPEAGQLSEVMRKIANGETKSLIDKGQLSKGCKNCIQLIEEGKLKEGHIICTVRSFAHHMFQDLKLQEASNAMKLLQKAIKYGGCDILDYMGRKKLKKRGDNDRRIAYMHMAIYVGQCNGKHYVAENAGAYDQETRMGRIVINEITESFNDFANDDSAFFLIKPHKDRHTTQQNALAAVHDKLEFRYHIQWFNCEAFTSICAGFYDPDAKDKNINPEFQRRVLMNEKKDEETLKKDRIYWFEPYKDKMLEIFSQRKSEIDGHQFTLSVGQRGKLAVALDKLVNKNMSIK